MTGVCKKLFIGTTGVCTSLVAGKTEGITFGLMNGLKSNTGALTAYGLKSNTDFDSKTDLGNRGTLCSGKFISQVFFWPNAGGLITPNLNILVEKSKNLLLYLLRSANLFFAGRK